MGVLRSFQEPIIGMVRDVDLRQSDEEPELPATAYGSGLASRFPERMAELP
jgi:hypothetical protein